MLPCGVASLFVGNQEATFGVTVPVETGCGCAMHAYACALPYPFWMSRTFASTHDFWSMSRAKCWFGGLTHDFFGGGLVRNAWWDEQRAYKICKLWVIYKC